MNHKETAVDPLEAPTVKAGGAASAFRQSLQRVKQAVICGMIGRRVNRTERHGYELGRKPDFQWCFNGISNYSELFDAWINNNPGNTWDMSRFYMLYLNARQVFREDLQGDIVELGVYRGNSAAILASYARENERWLYLFDTFTGFDPSDLTGHDSHRKTDFTNTSLEMVKQLVGDDHVCYVKGFFPASCSQIQLPEKIVLAHIDCDLYKPIKAGLEHFYPRVVPGGLILVHDYGSGYWPGATLAVDEFFAHRPEKPILIPDKSGTAVIRKVS